MARGDAEWIQDIILAVVDIRTDTAGMAFTSFVAKPAIVRSVLYSIAVMGEAAKNINQALKAARPAVPWRAIAGISGRIVHEYSRTNTSRIRDVVTDDIDALDDALRGPLNRPASAL